MIIYGLQKTSLIDYPGLVSCTIFLFGCNFRCGFCYNPELVIKKVKKEGIIKSEDIIKFLNKKKGKLDGVCITGGEPLQTLEKDFLKEIKKIGYKIKIDTNGSYPKILKEIIEEKLVDYVAMDIKGDKENYSKITGVNVKIEDIEESIRLIHNFKDYEFRITIVSKFHDKEKMKKMGEWIIGILNEKPKVIYLQGFKRGKDNIDESFRNEKEIYEKDLKVYKEALEPYFKKVIIRG